MPKNNKEIFDIIQKCVEEHEKEPKRTKSKPVISSFEAQPSKKYAGANTFANVKAKAEEIAPTIAQSMAPLAPPSAPQGQEQLFSQFMNFMQAQAKPVEKPKRAKRVISAEQKAKLCEQLKRGRQTSLESRKKARELKENPPPPQPTKQEEQFSSLISKITELTSAMKQPVEKPAKKEEEDDDKFLSLPSKSELKKEQPKETPKPSPQAPIVTSTFGHASALPKSDAGHRLGEVTAPKINPVYFANKMKRSVF